jgi:hypothetical protein
MGLCSSCRPTRPNSNPRRHLWPLTNTALSNRHFASIDELEDAQAARCVALQAQRDLIRSTTPFHCGHSASRNDKDLVLCDR